ncbi:MAG: hypothetical protein JXR48_18235, partial [Candidatus Delongbacteria bacterium]|nr:hypothetical protein [Candidatus Delongbacteria bacterium]
EKIMKNSILYIILILMIVMTSCTEGLYNQLIWPSEDPLVVSPDVLSFSDNGLIVISWDDDMAAEEYILYKKPVNSLIEPEQIYRGTDLIYEDRNFPGLDGSCDILFHYSLSKTRGRKAFGPSIPGLGIYSENEEDEWEPNNRLEDATELITTKEALLYYYRDSYNTVVRDEDWYYVDVNAGYLANIIVDATEKVDAFQYQVYKQVQNSITLGQAFTIPNNSNEKKKIYFKIIPIISQFMADNNKNGGSMKSYNINLDGTDLIQKDN